MNESNGVIRDARKLGIPKMLILGLQHMFAMFGATILVPILVNSYFVDACGEGPSRGLTVSVTLFLKVSFLNSAFNICVLLNSSLRAESLFFSPLAGQFHINDRRENTSKNNLRYVLLPW